MEPSTLSQYILVCAHMGVYYWINSEKATCWIKFDWYYRTALHLFLAGPKKTPSPYSYQPTMFSTSFIFANLIRQKQQFISNFLVVNIQNLLNFSGSEIPLPGIYLKEKIKDDGQDVHCFIVCNLKRWKQPKDALVDYSTFVG